MSGELYSTEHFDALMRGKVLVHGENGNVELTLQYVDGFIGIPLFVEGGGMIGMDRINLAAALKKDQEANQERLLDFARNNNKSAMLQMLTEEREFYTKLMSEADLYAQKLTLYESENNLVLLSIYGQAKRWIEDLNLSAAYNSTRLPLIEGAINAAIKSRDKDLLISIFNLPQALEYFNANLYNILSTSGDTSYQVAEYLIRMHEIYLREQIRLGLQAEDSLDPRRYDPFLDAAARESNVELVKFLLAKLKAPNFELDYSSFFVTCVYQKNTKILLMLLSYDVFVEVLKSRRTYNIDKIFEINDKDLMQRLNELGVFDDPSELHWRLMTASKHDNIEALNIILAPEHASILLQITAGGLLSALKESVRTESYHAVFILMQNKLIRDTINNLYYMEPRLLESVLSELGWSRNFELIRTAKNLLLEPVFCKLALNSILDDIKQRVELEPEPGRERIDFSSLQATQINLLYFLLREPTLFEIFVSSIQYYEFMPKLVQQCMDIYRSSLESDFKLQEITVDNIDANLTMFLTLLSRSAPEDMSDYADMFAKQLLPALLAQQGNYINLLPFTDEKLVEMLKHLPVESLQATLNLLDHPLHTDLLLDILLRTINLRNDPGDVMLYKILDIIESNLTPNAVDVIIKNMSQGIDVLDLLLNTDQVGVKQQRSFGVMMTLSIEFIKMSDIFSASRRNVTDKNLERFFKVLQDLDLNRELALLKFLVNSTMHMNSIYSPDLGIGDNHKSWGDVDLRLHDIKTWPPENADESLMQSVDDFIKVNSALDKLQGYLGSVSDLLEKRKIKAPDELLALQEMSLHPKQRNPGFGSLKV